MQSEPVLNTVGNFEGIIRERYISLEYGITEYVKTDIILVIISGGDDEFIYRSLVEIFLVNLEIYIPRARIPDI
ncbi:MAG: hypothetical protein GY771_16040 [bacterium]|nr:hypothetical protein [bacterium]